MYFSFLIKHIPGEGKSATVKFSSRGFSDTNGFEIDSTVPAKITLVQTGETANLFFEKEDEYDFIVSGGEINLQDRGGAQLMQVLMAGVPFHLDVTGKNGTTARHSHTEKSDLRHANATIELLIPLTNMIVQRREKREAEGILPLHNGNKSK